jgi:hypothetical protein
MSWLIGTVGGLNIELKEKVISISGDSLFDFESKNLHIRGGGNNQTFFSGNRENTFFAACGTGISLSDSTCKILGQQDWNDLPEENIPDLNGHYIYARWNDDEIKIITDKYGLRDFYYYKYPDDTILFSTRSDWIAKIVGAELNYKTFGSRWLLFNQISNESIFNNITRINGGTSLTIYLYSLIPFEQKNAWCQNMRQEKFHPKTYNKIFESLTTIPVNNKQKLSLSLSGGMDSRVLLSSLLKRRIGFTAHTFGSSGSPDASVAKNITTEFGIEHEMINYSIKNAQNFLCDFFEYTQQSLVNNSMSSFLQLKNYDFFRNRNYLLIDGGFGEIWRREFFNRVFYRGKNFLLNKDISSIIPFLTNQRADIFNDDINKMMLEGCSEQLENIFNELPDIKEFGVENWLDLFAIKTRLSNYYSHEQIRVDGITQSYMPFIQPVLLDNLFGMSLYRRKNGKLFKKIIRKNSRNLEKFPLAKGQYLHPYWLNTLQTRLYLMAKRKFSKDLQNDSASKLIIDKLYPMVQDIINSQEVKNAGCYNPQKLYALSEKLSKKKLSDHDYHELDWWLAFEVFRKGILNKL